MENKEYKVITSNTPLFANREKMRRILEEEAQAGWQLVEKFNDYKLRLVRDFSARDNDANCSVDPYRTNVGLNNALYLGLAALGTLAVIYIVIQVAAMTVT